MQADKDTPVSFDGMQHDTIKGRPCTENFVFSVCIAHDKKHVPNIRLQFYHSTNFDKKQGFRQWKIEKSKKMDKTLEKAEKYVVIW